ncbi:hypothetical protein T492DRAFT_327669 [Pavlovales sp. CCMP2436]|nr:hypothetical protein T492DRAFT_327669 [Pavlovales sp. CCMP2436]
MLTFRFDFRCSFFVLFQFVSFCLFYWFVFTFLRVDKGVFYCAFDFGFVLYLRPQSVLVAFWCIPLSALAPPPP